ncbi:transposase, partial [Streptomyces sp. NPDC096030]|uniref:transposase n=1 Tax=Streptomyces sp. NPDC096030 TaxID=3155423 RepID=UPI00332B348F
FRTAAGEVTEAELPAVEVLGIGETRRGRPRWKQDPATGKWQLTRDRWHTGFVDALGTGGRLGQAEGRSAADVLAWLSTTPLTWRKKIRYVAIDMSATYRAAIRTGLPDAMTVVDHFHAVQLANKMLSTVRRRTTAEVRGRRGRATDPERKARNRLLRNREDLSHEQFERMWNPLLDAGPTGQRLLTPWIAKESLRTLLALARTHADREQTGHAKRKSLTWCADSDTPEVTKLAATVDRWWPETAASIETGHHNAKSEGDQPRDQARRPQRLRFPQCGESAATDTVRHHPASPRTPLPRLTSKTQHPAVYHESTLPLRRSL